MLAQVTVRHQPNELGHAHLFDRLRRHVTAVSHDGDMPADTEHLVETMRDVDDGDAARGQAIDEREELRHLAARERGRRLVHDEDRRVACLVRRSLGGAGLARRSLGGGGRERLRNLDHLPLREAQASDRRARIERHAEVEQQCRRAFVQRAPVDDAAPARRQFAQKNVLGGRQVRNEVELLVDDADAAIARIARAGNLHGQAVETNLAGVLAIGAAQNLHQRRLAGAVLSEQHVHVAGFDGEVHGVERDHAGKGLADPAHFERGRPIARIHRIVTSTGSPPARIVTGPSHLRIDTPGRSCSSSMNILLMRVS